MPKAFPTSTLNREPDRDDEVVKRFQRVHYWPKLEIAVPIRRDAKTTTNPRCASVCSSVPRGIRAARHKRPDKPVSVYPVR